MAVKIITDSASDINKKEAEQLGISMLSMTIRFGEDEYLDGDTLLPEEFYDKLIESDELPKTSQVNPFAFEQEFARAGEDEVVVITISSKLSGTYKSAEQAARGYKGKVYVVDSLSACIGQRLLCYLAIKLRDEGKSAKEIAEELNSAKKRINVMAMLNTLEYLRKGGRISAVSAAAGGLLSIKPVVAIEDGRVVLAGKAMGSKKAENLLNSLVNKKGGIDFSMPYGTVWSGKDRSTLEKYINDSACLWEGHTDNIPFYPIGTTIGTHVGPGAIGVAFFEKI